MENNLENKACFFALHLFQEAVIIGDGTQGLHDEKYKQAGRYKIDTEALDSLYRIGDCGDAVELTPISAITDEDAIEVAKIMYPKDKHNDKDSLEWGKSIADEIIQGQTDKDVIWFSGIIGTVDYLRSKGYALPYHDITVEQQIEYGWVKLKKIN